VCADALAYFGARPGLVPGRRHDGDGVFRQMVLRPLDLSWPFPFRVGSSRRELAAVHLLMVGLAHDRWGRSAGGRLEGLVAERFEDVVAAFEQLAREREARSVTADSLGGL
jgi:hypothetical protein